MADAGLSSMQDSILKEIGTVGTAHAATALSKMTGLEVKVKPTTTEVMPLEEAYKIFSSVPEMQVGIYRSMREGLSGCLVFFIPKGRSYGLLDLLMNRPGGSTAVLGEFEQSALRESGGIICASYINAIAAMTKLTIRLTIPKLIFDQNGQVLDAILKGLFPPSTEVIVIENEFSLMDKSVTGYFLMVPEAGELSRLLGLLEAHIA